MSDRCPQCSATVRPDADWCTLCYADLRPAPPPAPEPAPEPVAAMPAHVMAAAVANAGLSAPGFDALSAPLDVVTGLGAPAAAEPTAVAGFWPCLRCRAANSMERDVCKDCGLPFGSGLGEKPVELPGTRKSRNLMAFAIVGVVVFIVGLVSLLLTSPPPKDGSDIPGVTTGEAPGVVVPAAPAG